ncbi:MAG: hypothetical protein QM628_15385 [Propionicimonas sp.]
MRSFRLTIAIRDSSLVVQIGRLRTFFSSREKRSAIGWPAPAPHLPGTGSRTRIITLGVEQRVRPLCLHQFGVGDRWMIAEGYR